LESCARDPQEECCHTFVVICTTRQRSLCPCDAIWQIN
jgi:hypothetical protein